MHALIIEDESLIAMTLEEILEDCGFTSFDIASSSAEAISAARLKCPTLITADVELSPGCGIEAIKAICGQSLIPVIFITGSPSEVVSRMPDHPLIAKPFTSQAVMAAVRSALAISGKVPQ